MSDVPGFYAGRTTRGAERGPYGCQTYPAGVTLTGPVAIPPVVPALPVKRPPTPAAHARDAERERCLAILRELAAGCDKGYRGYARIAAEVLNDAIARIGEPT